jgi:hypothetical protein
MWRQQVTSKCFWSRSTSLHGLTSLKSNLHGHRCEDLLSRTRCSMSTDDTGGRLRSISGFRSYSGARLSWLFTWFFPPAYPQGNGMGQYLSQISVMSLHFLFMSVFISNPAVLRKGLINLWLYKENKLRDWKKMYLHILPWVPRTYDFVVLTF